MEKYQGTFADGYLAYVWSTDIDNARFHLKDWCRLHGELVEIKLITACPEDYVDDKKQAASA